AANLYEILIEDSPSGDSSNVWRIKQAHSYYFAGQFEKAANLYTELKSKHKLDDESLEISSYQLVLAREKLWREELNKANLKGQSLKESPIVIEALRNLEQSVEEFSNRFPAKERSVDLLLVAASANRDMERFSDANKYW